MSRRKTTETLEPGTIVAGRYRIVSLLGAGGMGAVYEAVDEVASPPRPLALKTLEIDDEAVVRALRVEFSTLSDLRHPHLARVHDFGHDAERGRSFFSTELIRGVELLEWAAEREPQELAQALAHVLKALGYVHRRGLVHRDVKSQNVLVEQDEQTSLRAVLVDFGLAAVSTPTEGGPVGLAGTVAYLAPEVIGGQAATPASDLYSLGVVIAQHFVGPRIVRRGAGRDLRADVRKSKRLPESWQEWLLKLLAPDPLERFGDARDVLAAMVHAGVLPEEAIDPAPVTAPLLGRSAETHELEALVSRLLRRQDSDAGHPDEAHLPAVVTIRGAPGAGASRLLAEIKRRSQPRLAGRGELALASCASPERPLGDIAVVAGAVAAILGREHPLCRKHQAALQELLGWDDGEGTAGTGSDGDLLADSVASFVTNAGSHAPIVVAFDDLDASEQESSRIIAYLIRRLTLAHRRGDRHALLMLVLPDGAPVAGEVTAALEDAEHSGALQTIQLRPLGAGDVEAIARSLLGARQLPSGFAKQLHATTGGAPGMVVSICEMLLDRFGRDTARGARASIDLSAVDLRTVELPRGLEESLAVRLEALGTTEARVVRLLAAAERPLSAAQLAHCGGMKQETLAPVAAELVKRGFVRQTPTHRYALEGHAIGRAALKRAGVAAARRAHARLAAALQEVDGDEEERRSDLDARIAVHLCRAGETDGAARALELAGRKARAGENRGALRLLDAAEPLARGEDARTLLQLVIDLRARTGAYPDAIAAAERLLALTDDPDEQEHVHRRLGELCVLSGRYDDALGHLEAALQGADGIEAGICHGLAARAMVMRGDHAAALTRCEEALRLVEEQDGDLSSEVMAHIRATVGLARYFGGAYDEAVTNLRRALQLYREEGTQPREEAFVLNCLGLCYHGRGTYDLALEYYAQSADTARRIGDRSRVARASMNQGVVAQFAGDYAAARAAYEESLDAARLLGVGEGIRRALVNLANLYAVLGSLGRARRLTREYLEAAERAGDRRDMAYARLLLGGIALKANERDQAREMLTGARRALQELSAPSEEVEALLDLGRLDLEGRELDAAEATCREAQELVERHALTTLTPRVALLQAEIALARGANAAPIVEMLQQAAAGADGAAPPLRWRLHGALARALHAAGSFEEARSHATRAREILAGMATRTPEDLRADFAADRERREAGQMLDMLTATSAPSQTSHPSFSEAGPANDHLQELLKINRRLINETDVDKLLGVIMDTAIDLCGAERGFVLLVNEHGEIRTAVARNIEQDSLADEGARSAISMSIAREVIDTHDPVVTVDAMDDSRFRGMMSIVDLRLRSIMCAALLHRGRALGAVYVDNRYRREAFGEQHLLLLEAFADQAAIALANAQHIEQLEKQRAEIQRAHAEVADLNKKLEAQLQDRTRDLNEARADLTRARRDLTGKYEHANIIGHASSMRRVLSVVDRITDSDLPVVIYGESGTGKELIARAVHFNGARSSRPFQAVNCAALAETLLESELFGHVRGSFTGADRDRKGLFEAAHTGTLFLDEVGDMPPSMQVKLLRALQEKEITRVGGNKSIQVDVRVLCATNRNLEELKDSGDFREDLYYRLNVVRIELPALRDRLDDLPALVQHFIDRYRETNGQGPRGASPKTLEVLAGYPWPGNIRELEAAVGGACLFAADELITPDDLAIKPELFRRQQGSESLAAFVGRPLAEVERAVIQATLRQTDGNKLEAARLLGIDRKTLYNKLRKYEEPEAVAEP